MPVLQRERDRGALAFYNGCRPDFAYSVARSYVCRTTTAWPISMTTWRAVVAHRPDRPTQSSDQQTVESCRSTHEPPPVRPHRRHLVRPGPHRVHRAHRRSRGGPRRHVRSRPSPAPTLDPYAAGHAHGQQRRADYPDYVPTGDVLKDVKQSGMWNMSRAMKIAVHCGEWSAKSAPDSTASTNPLGGPSAESPQDAWRRGCVDGANDDPPTPVKS